MHAMPGGGFVWVAVVYRQREQCATYHNAHPGASLGTSEKPL